MNAFLVILFACAVYGFFHSLLASLWIKHQVRRLLGERFFRWYRLLYNLFVSVTFLPVLGLMALLPDHTLYVIPFPWVWVSGAIQLVSVVVMAFALRQSGLIPFLGLNAFLDRSASAQESLTLGGLYAWVRHPIYTAGLIFLWLTPVLTQNLLALNIGLTLYIFIGAWLEERKMVAQFGEAYRRYKEQVPMFIPYRFPKKQTNRMK